MADALAMPEAEDAAQQRQTILGCLAEIDRLREQMRRDDIEIARFQARTWALLAEIKADREAAERKAA